MGLQESQPWIPCLGGFLWKIRLQNVRSKAKPFKCGKPLIGASVGTSSQVRYFVPYLNTHPFFTNALTLMSYGC